MHFCKPKAVYDNKPTSSANMRHLSLNWFIDTGSHESSKISGKSDKYRLNSIGPNTHPCFTPTQDMLLDGDNILFIFTWYCTPEYMFWIIDRKLSPMSYLNSFKNSAFHQNVSEAILKSKEQANRYRHGSWLMNWSIILLRVSLGTVLC